MKKLLHLWLPVLGILIIIAIFYTVFRFDTIKQQLKRKTAEQSLVIKTSPEDEKKELFESFTPTVRTAAERLDTLVAIDTLPYGTEHANQWNIFYSKVKNISNSVMESGFNMKTTYYNDTTGSAYVYCIKKTDYYNHPKGTLEPYAKARLIHYGVLTSPAVIRKHSIPAGTYIITVDDCDRWVGDQSTIWYSSNVVYSSTFEKFAQELQRIANSKASSPHSLDLEYWTYTYNHSTLEYYTE